MNTKPLAYYMPVYLTQKAEQSQNSDLKEFCTLFKVVNNNACVIDRTGTLTTPFQTHSFYPVPEQSAVVEDFGTLCINRAEEILNQNMQVFFMYSGGLDSTSMLVAFHEVLKRRGDFSQLIIATSPDAQSENPDAWAEIVRPYYKLIQARDMLADVSLNNCRYVQGENADQLFGSDRVFTDPVLLHQPYSIDNLKTFLHARINTPHALERFITEFSMLANKCPLPVKFMRDFLWWVNFTCKWQSVALRTLSFSNVFENFNRVTFDDVSNFETFFNTVPFQQLAISGLLDRWGESPSPYTYKQAARDFIHQYTGWSTYTRTKIKVGSLYNVIRQRTYVADAVAYESGKLFATHIDV